MQARIERSDNFMTTASELANEWAEAYRVGGSVRDEFLGREPKDADYVVFNAELDDLKVGLEAALKADNYTRDVSIKPLTPRSGSQIGWRVAARGLGCIEITLPRTEVSTGPRPQDFDIRVNPALSIQDDAQRRDFTWNALYKSTYNGVVIDGTGKGLYDLEHKLIRTTHPDSFRDDPLRTLRALRFVSTLGYDLTADARAQMELYATAVDGLTSPVTTHPRLCKCHGCPPITRGGYTSGTVLRELSKLLMGDGAVDALRIMRDTGVMAVLLPELAPMIGFDQASRWHTYTTDEHTFAALEMAVRVDAPLRVRMALLFHDSAKPATAWMDRRGRKHYYASEENGFLDHDEEGAKITEAALSRLGSERRFRLDVTTLVREHMLWAKEGPVKDSEVGRMRVKLGNDLFRDLIMHRMCDACGKRQARMEDLRYFGAMERRRAEMEALGVPTKTSELAIRGRDLLDAGCEPTMIGFILKAVLDQVVCQPDELRMSRDWQLKRALNMKEIM